MNDQEVIENLDLLLNLEMFESAETSEIIEILEPLSSEEEAGGKDET